MLLNVCNIWLSHLRIDFSFTKLTPGCCLIVMLIRLLSQLISSVLMLNKHLVIFLPTLVPMCDFLSLIQS